MSEKLPNEQDKGLKMCVRGLKIQKLKLLESLRGHAFYSQLWLPLKIRQDTLNVDGILKLELWTDPAYLTLTLISDFPVHSCSFKIIPTRSRDIMFIQTTF